MTKPRGSLKKYHYTECGLGYIYLIDGVNSIASPRGKTIHIQHIEGLHRAIGEMLIFDRKNLDGPEFRFLRHELNMTQQNLAVLLGVDVQTVGRYERERRTDIPGPAQRIVRLLYSEKINNNRDICEPLERLAELDEMSAIDEVDFQETSDGWQQALAA
jgi:DNA-binding transcriptional regulator YiaG